jgi:thiosulfate dehydrogenase
MTKFLVGLVLGLLIVPAVVWGYFRFGNPPVAVADPPLPFEKQIVKMPLHAVVDREMPHTSPIAPSDPNLMAGAVTYRAHCAVCHGLPGRPADIAGHMYPSAPQLFKWHREGVIGVSDDPAGETYWKVANGIRLTGMPSFDKILTTTQMWQVTLLLKNANKTLPDAAVQLLNQPLPTDGAMATPTTEALTKGGAKQ